MPANSGPSRTPSKKLVKKLQYTEAIKLNNATTTYSYYSRYIRPDITLCTGAVAQFAAYELWRIKKIKVSIQMADGDGAAGASALNNVPTAVIWSASDLGANESISGESIMQYQNVKRNTPSLNKWTNIIDTSCNVNASLQSGASWNFILPRDTWLNTSYFDSSSYSGYQLFIQNFGTQNNAVASQPAFTVQTELIVEFMQPAFQTTTSSFTVEAFGIQMVTQPDAADPTVLRTYAFNKYQVLTNPAGEREFKITLKRQDGIPGSLVFTNTQLREAIITGTSGIYFDGRPIKYDGPLPPKGIPDVNYEVINE